MFVKPEDEKLNQFMYYLVENYIDPQSGFPPHTWADMSSSSEHRSSETSCSGHTRKL
jgi:hypothetical protein